MGFNVSNNNAEEFANRILLLIENEELRMKMSLGARKCAEERFDRRNTYMELVNTVGGHSA